MKALARRLTRLGPTIASLRPLSPPSVDPTVLTAEEMEEAGRIAATVRVGGLAVLSDADLDRAECLRRKLTGQEIDAWLG
jgi:hypothetical protein